MLYNLTFMQMIIFAECAKEKSFTKAARKMDLTPSAVSKTISCMEKRLGSRLFERNTKKIAITRAGSYLLLFCNYSIDIFEEALKEAESIYGMILSN